MLKQKEWIEVIVAKTGCTKKDAKMFYDCVFDYMREQISPEELIKISGFGVLKLRKTAAKEQVFAATGKRKRSIARVRLTVGTGKITINGRDIEEYLPLATLRIVARQPLVLTETDKSVDVVANIVGGGFTGQAGALRHGITRALMLYNPTLRTELKKAGFVTRDARIKERKKYGLKKARKAPQFSKR